MSRTQFIALNILGGLLAALVLADVSFSLWNQRLTARSAARQAVVNNARQAEAVLRRLTLRIAQSAEQDPVLMKLLVRHELKATFVVDGKKKEVP